MMQKRHYFVLGLLIAIIGIALDQFSKNWILDFFLTHDEPHDITDFFNLVIVWNRGVSFGMFASEHSFAQFILLGVTALISLFLLAWMFKTRRVFMSFSLGLIIAGAFGNMIDRIKYGAVLDFLDFFWNDMHWPAFNVADICISTGVFLMIIDVLTQKQSTNEDI